MRAALLAPLLAARAIVLTRNQQRFLEALEDSSKPVVVCVGPAGTGKTMLACKSAKNCGKKVMFTRPTIVTGGDMGFLPGNLQDKMDPFMFHITKDNSKFVPKAYEIFSLQHMRGRTFDNSFVFADEMQNSTITQMKMLLTRIGHDSKIVVCGDLMQSDLPEPNGLEHIASILRNRDSTYAELVELHASDISRSEAAKEMHDMYSSAGPPPGSP